MILDLASQQLAGSEQGASSKESELTAAQHDRIIAPTMPSLRLISWNLDGLDARHIDLRTEAACQIILERAPDVVFLQEVVERSFFAHLRPWMQGVGYRASPPQLTKRSRYGCIMFTRPPLTVLEARREPFTASQMGRSLLHTTVRWEGRELLLLTAHLESLREGRPERVQQLDVVRAALGAHAGPAVFAGDTNLRDSEVAGKEIRDAWSELGGPRQCRYTFDAFAIPNKKGRTRARYDRVFLSAHPGWRSTEMSLLGMASVPGAGGLFPSDHAGIEVLLSLSED